MLNAVQINNSHKK